MAAAAHDLRNPIAVVRASAQMVLRQFNRNDYEAARVRIASIVDQTERLSEMLETFLDAARIGAGRLQPRRERLNARDLVQAAAERARQFVALAAERPVDVDVPDGCFGVWDRARVERAVRALVINALMYGDAQAPVRIQGRQEDGHSLRLQVSGGGAGPDGEEAAHLFERFFRGRSAAEAGQSGSGLGLYTARGIARVHGGDVRHVSGDTFELVLPLAESRQDIDGKDG